MHSLTEDLVNAIISKYGDSLPRLNLESNCLQGIAGIERFHHVSSLSLACNEIQDISPLAYMSQIEILNLAENKIESIQHLSKLASLRSLDISGNLLESVEETVICLQHLSKLEVLRIAGNPLCSRGNFTSRLFFDSIPSLRWLDDIERPAGNVSERIASADAEVSSLGGSGVDVNLQRKIRALESQLAAMERAFTVQERVLSQRRASAESGRDENKYFDVLQRWRKHALQALVEKFSCERSLFLSIEEKKRLRAIYCAEVLTLEANLVSAQERMSALVAQTQELKAQVTSCESENLSLQLSLRSSEEKMCAQSLSVENIKAAMEEASRRLASSADFQRLSQASAALLAFESRLGASVQRLETARSILALKEVSLRNSAAAVEAEKALWLQQRGNGGAPADDPAPITRQSGLQRIDLRPESESLLRSIFNKLDIHSAGTVEVCDLITCFEDVESNKLRALLVAGIGAAAVDCLLAGLRSLQSKGAANLTWGELLLLLFPQPIDVQQAPLDGLTAEEVSGLERQKVWGDLEWAALQLVIPTDLDVSVKERSSGVLLVDPVETVRLANERAFLMKKCQEMHRTMERRAERIKSYFANDLKIKQLKEQSQLQQIELLMDRVVALERAREESEVARVNSIEALREQLYKALEDNAGLLQRIEYLQDSEGHLVDKRIADEVSRYNKLDTENKLLKREHSKLEVRCKSLQRDLMRVQVNSSVSSETMERMAAENDRLLKDNAELQFERTSLHGRFQSALESLASHSEELERLRRDNQELSQHNASMTKDLNVLASAQHDAIEQSTVCVDTADLQLYAKGSAASVKLEAASIRDLEVKAVVAPPARPALAAPNSNQVDMLEVNIARLTRLADALLSRDD